jgi:fused signal recognition particle receptor
MRFWRRDSQAPDPEYADILQPSGDVSVEATPAALAIENPETEERRGWFNRLRAGMARSSARLTEGINTIFNRRRLDDEALDELEELLIASDMGVGIAAEVTEALRKTRFNQRSRPRRCAGLSPRR